MTRPLAPARTPWIMGPLGGSRKRPDLLFGQMHEDWALESRVFPRGARVFAIASAGTTALRLAARGDQVTAVDVSAAQIAYVERRLEGSPVEDGAVDRLLARGRRAIRRIWAGEQEIVEFLLLEDAAEQVRFWRRRLDTLPFRGALALALHPRVLRWRYAKPFVAALPRCFATEIRQRLEEGFARHPNRTNPFAWRLLLGRDPPGSPPFGLPPPGSVSLVHAEAAAYLEGCPPASFDAFTISNILDGAAPPYRARLERAILGAASPGAAVVLRTLAEPANRGDVEWARRDRSLIWGGIQVARVNEGGLEPCCAW